MELENKYMKKVSEDEIYKVISDCMKKYLLDKKSNWNVFPIKELAHALISYLEGEKNG